MATKPECNTIQVSSSSPSIQALELYQGDRPIESTSEDRFGRSEFAKRIAGVIAKRKDASSVVIGIYGPWGNGKTSVLNLITQELQKDANVIPIRFNPWRFTDESQLLRNFFEMLADRLEKSLSTKGEKLAKFLKQYAGVLAPVSYFGIDAKEAVESMAGVRPEADLDELKSRVEEVLREAKKRLVILMDDIDRLDKQEIQAIFKLVKLSADFPFVSYVLAFDEEMVAAALAEKYGNLEAGKKFLEKIIQVPLHLPPARSEILRDLCFEGINAAFELAEIELPQSEEQRFVGAFIRAFERRMKTPRQVKQYATAISFVLPLVNGEVNTVDLLLIEAIRIFFPKLYSAIKADPACFLASDLEWSFNRRNAEEDTKTKIGVALEGLMPGDRDAAGVVIKELFPRVGFVFKGSHYGSDWQETWQKQKRIASTSYFDRYFAYGVPPKDISDRRVEALIAAATKESAIDLLADEIRLLAKTSAKALMGKLWVTEGSVARDGVANIAIAIASCGEVFPYNNGPLGSNIVLGSSLGQACHYIRELLRKIEDADVRDKIALMVADKIPTLIFAREYYQATGKLSDEPDPENESIVSDNCRHTILQSFASRVAAEATQDSLFDKYPDHFLGLLWMWFWADEHGVRSFLCKCFTNQPEEAIKFLRRAVDNFRQQECYENICRLVDPHIVVTSIEKIYPDLANTNYALHTQENWGKRAALMFIESHTCATSPRTGATG